MKRENIVSTQHHDKIRWGILVFGIVMAVFLIQTSAGAASVIPPHGQTYNELEAKWWQKVFLIPVVNGTHPLVTGGPFGGEEGILFLTGVSGPVEFNITIPPGTALFFPVVNTECSELEPDPYHGDNPGQLRKCAKKHIKNTSERFSEIDGESLESYRVESQIFEFGPLQQDNVFQFWGMENTVGVTSDAVDVGYYILLAPLSVGEHTLHFGGTFDEFNFSIDTRYNITVEP